MSRFGFVGGRTLQAIPVVLGVTIISFFVLRLIPGDPTVVMLGTHWTPARAEQLRHSLGLNKPIWDQYYLFMNHLFHGNLGQSLYYRSPVAHLIAQRLPVTLWLTTYATVLAIIISVPLATISALRRNGVIDQTVRGTFLLAFAMPPFWVGLVLILLLSLQVPRLSGRGLRQRLLRAPVRPLSAVVDDLARVRGDPDPNPSQRHPRRPERGLHRHRESQGPRVRDVC